MKDSAGQVIGVRLRRRDGTKRAVTGSRQGLFLPTGASFTGPLFICEGPTDTGALLDLGLDAIGRPSCQGGGRRLCRLLHKRICGEVVIIADADEQGINGARRLAHSLCAYVPTVAIIRPPAPIKDAREWRIAGATAADVLEASRTVVRARIKTRRSL